MKKKKMKRMRFKFKDSASMGGFTKLIVYQIDDDKVYADVESKADPHDSEEEIQKYFESTLLNFYQQGEYAKIKQIISEKNNFLKTHIIPKIETELSLEEGTINEGDFVFGEESKDEIYNFTVFLKHKFDSIPKDKQREFKQKLHAFAREVARELMESSEFGRKHNRIKLRDSAADLIDDDEVMFNASNAYKFAKWVDEQFERKEYNNFGLAHLYIFAELLTWIADSAGEVTKRQALSYLRDEVFHVTGRSGVPNGFFESIVEDFWVHNKPTSDGTFTPNASESHLTKDSKVKDSKVWDSFEEEFTHVLNQIEFTKVSKMTDAQFEQWIESVNHSIASLGAYHGAGEWIEKLKDALDKKKKAYEWTSHLRQEEVPDLKKETKSKKKKIKYRYKGNVGRNGRYYGYADEYVWAYSANQALKILNDRLRKEWKLGETQTIWLDEKNLTVVEE